MPELFASAEYRHPRPAGTPTAHDVTVSAMPISHRSDEQVHETQSKLCGAMC